MRRYALRVLWPVLAVIVFGALGYIVFWGWSPLDALYMVVITVGTVGYREVRPLGVGGQIYTMCLIVAGIVAGGYALSRLFALLLEAELTGVWGTRRMEKTINRLSGHTVLAGMGRVGSAVARTLADEAAAFVVIDTCDDCIATAREEGWLYVQADATEEEVLLQAGIERAGALVTALDTDAENLFVTVSARSLNPDLFIVARSSHETTEAKLLKAGANRVLTPNLIGGRRMATMVLNPTVSDYLDLVSHGSGLEYRLQEVELEPGSWLDGKSIAQSRVREATGAYILAVRHRDGRIDSNPSAATVVHAGDHLVVLGTGQQVEAITDPARRSRE